MSLVNDMLRDLDSRRREAPGGDLGAERLIPASDFVRRRDAGFPFRKLVLPVLLVLAVVVVAALFFLDVDSQNRIPVAAPIAVNTQPVAPVPAQSSSSLDAAMLEEISRMQDRVRELEARTLSLQQGAAPGQDAATQAATSPDLVQPPLDVAPIDSAVSSIPAPVTVQSAVTPAQQPVSPAQTPVVEPAAPMASTLVRSASELTFRETDRLQVQQALALWQGNQRTESLALLKQFSTQNPEAHQSREMLAKLLVQQGDTIASMEQADMGLVIAPNHGGYKKVKARIMMTAGVPRDAAELLQLNAPSLASDIEYHELMAAAQLAGQLYDEAVLTYRTLTASDAEQARWWYGLGAALDATGSPFEAAQAYERAVQLGGLSANLLQQSQQRIVAIRQN